MKKPGPVLVINAGSSSIKYAVFGEGLDELARGMVEIETEARARPRGGVKRPPLRRRRISGATGAAGRFPALPPDGSPNHAQALSAILARLDKAGLPLTALSAAAHRVVHGGARLTAPARLTPETIAEIRACIPLAPLHNPHNLAAIETLARIAPDLAQFASFDTAFHATNPEVATTYAIPPDWRERGIRRYGFHGISYQALVENFHGPLPERLLAFHLGNGASACAIHRGRSVATTMGYSPLEGLTMGTRSGAIDAAAVLRLAAETGPDEVLERLNRESGLLGLSGESSDMRTLLESDSAAARLAVEHFCYWAARHGAGLIAAMGGLDAIAFTGGIGENAAPVREAIVELLGWTGVSPAAIHVIPAREERQIAANARALMRK